MIVRSMTPEEVYMEIDRDMQEVCSWWMKKRKELVRIAKWTVRLPRTSWYEFESSRKNRYIVMSVIMGRRYNKASLTCVFALQKMDRGFAVFFTRWPWQMVANRMVLLPHVFDRYADPKRGNVGKTGIDLIKHFVERNAYGEPTRDDKLSGRSVRYAGRDNICLSVQDGVLLGEECGDIFIAHTFITYEMATGLQREVFEQNKGKVLSSVEVFDTIKGLYNIK